MKTESIKLYDVRLHINKAEIVFRLLYGNHSIIIFSLQSFYIGNRVNWKKNWREIIVLRVGEKNFRSCPLFPLIISFKIITQKFKLHTARSALGINNWRKQRDLLFLYDLNSAEESTLFTQLLFRDPVRCADIFTFFFARSLFSHRFLMTSWVRNVTSDMCSSRRERVHRFFTFYYDANDSRSKHEHGDVGDVKTEPQRCVMERNNCRLNKGF